MNLPRFPRGIEAWFNDRLGLRETLLGLRSRLLVDVFGVSPTPLVLLGREHWVALTEGRVLDMQRGLAPFAALELDNWKRVLEERARWCAERNIRYVYALAPAKTAIYPEMLDDARCQLGPTRIDQLAPYMQQHSTVTFIDLRAALLTEKAFDREGDWTYFPYGSHWTSRGAFAASETLVQAMRAWFPEIPPLARENLGWRCIDDPGDNWDSAFYIPGHLQQQTFDPVLRSGPRLRVVEVGGPSEQRWTYESDRTELPRLFVVHDSFGIALRRHLAVHFSRSVFRWQPELPLDEIEAEHPDVLLEMFVERKLTETPRRLQLGSNSDLRAAFEASRSVLARLDPLRDASFVTARANAKVAYDAQRISVEWRDANSLIQLPEFHIPPGQRAIVRLALHDVRASMLLLLYRTSVDADYVRRQSFKRELQAGANELYFELAVPDLNGPLGARWGVPGDTGQLVAFEARAVDG